VTGAPRISVITPTYRGALWIEETIRSVQAQTVTDWEMVIVDDCSPDDTRAVLARVDDARIRVIHAERNGGPVAARNIAFAQARGELIVGLDQDDIALPQRFERQLAHLDAHPGCVLVASGTDHLEDGQVRVQPREGELAGAAMAMALMLRNPVPWSSVMFRAAAARRLDPFERQEVLYAEDFDLYHRLLPHGTITRLAEVLTLYRVHPGGISKLSETTMWAAAGRVLAEAYRPIFGESAADAAADLGRLIGAGEPARSAAELEMAAERIDLIELAVEARHGRSAEDRAAIRAETAGIWWRVVRAAARSGAVPLRRALAIRPDWVRAGGARLDDMVLTGLIGHGRRLAPRRAGLFAATGGV
jgi:GT2 family glycosyltransferase